MFKRFQPDQQITGRNVLKSSAQRGFRTKLIELYPNFEPIMDLVLPKKSSIYQIKCHDKIALYSVEEKGGRILFFDSHDEGLVPTLRLLYWIQALHPELNAIKSVTVDFGAIKPLLGGSNLMRPGVVSLGEEPFESNEFLAVKVQGKEGILGIGRSVKSKEELETATEGIALEMMHVIGDGLWKFNPDPDNSNGSA